MAKSFLMTTPANLTDAEQFFQLLTEPEVKKEFPHMRFNNIEDARHYLKGQIDNTQSVSPNFFKAIRIVFDEGAEIYTDSNSIFIGFICLSHTGTADYLFSGGFKQTLSYAIKSSYTGKGLMTIALEMILDAMAQDGYNYVAARVKLHNLRSEKVLQKCGFDKISKGENRNGFTYVKRLAMNENEYNQMFNF